MRRFLLPLLLMLLFIGESIFVELLPAKWYVSDHILVPRFLMAGILFLTLYGTKKHGIIYGLVFGLLFDVVYTEIIGIYLFLFPLIAYIISNLMKILQTNIIMSVLMTLFGVALLELGAYEMNFLIHQTDMEFSSFASMRLVPTLILNLIFIVLAGYPLKRQFEKFADSLND